jgi:tetratricopeptide (TPR) repeat protein
MAGVGKTTLAVHAAHLLASRFPDGQLYLDLRGFDRSGMVQSPQDAVRQLLAGLGVPADRVPGEPDAQIGLYRSVLAGRRVLIVLDNARSAEQVRPLLPGARDCQVLVTSRDQMRSLIAIEGARLVGLSPLSPDDAKEALTRRLGADRVAQEPEAVDKIVALCAGLPLTLSIVAARAATRPTHSLSSIATDLTRSGTGLHALADPDSAADARASLALSYHALSPGAARILRLSSLHPGAEASRDALASLAGVTATEAEGDLDELERVYLMTQPEPSRYACHDVVRAYAAELAAEDDAADEDEVRLRLFDHYRQSAFRAMLTLRSNRSPVPVPDPLPGVTVAGFGTPEDAFGWFAGLYPVLRVLLERTAEHNLPEYTWQLAWSLDPFHDRQARWQDKSWVHRNGLVAAEKLGNLTWQAHSHRSLGSAFRLLGDLQRAMEHFGVAQRLYVEFGNVYEQAMNLHNLVAVFQALDLPEQALTHARRALELSEEIEDRQLQAIALNNLGWMYSNDGDQAAAIDCAQRALVLLEEADEVNLRAQLVRTLGQCQYRSGDTDLAMPQLMEALGIFHDQHDRYEEAYTLRWIAIAQRAAGHDAPARRAWQRALPILSDLGDDLPAFESFAAEDASTRR